MASSLRLLKIGAEPALMRRYGDILLPIQIQIILPAPLAPRRTPFGSESRTGVWAIQPP